MLVLDLKSLVSNAYSSLDVSQQTYELSVSSSRTVTLENSKSLKDYSVDSSKTTTLT